MRELRAQTEYEPEEFKPLKGMSDAVKVDALAYHNVAQAQVNKMMIIDHHFDGAIEGTQFSKDEGITKRDRQDGGREEI